MSFPEMRLVEPRPLAGAAGYLHVGHEVELRGDHSFALALFAPAALDVEAEPPRLVGALHRQRRPGEQVPNWRSGNGDASSCDESITRHVPVTVPCCVEST